MSALRILTVSNVPLDPSLGSGYVIDGYVKRLRARGHTVITLQPCDYLPKPRWRVARRLRMLLGYTAATRRALARERFDLVELWGGESWRIARELTARRSRPVVIGRSNGLETHVRSELARHGAAAAPALLTRWFDRWQNTEDAFRHADTLTVVSDYERRFTLARGYQTADRLLTLENPLPDDWLGLPPTPNRPPVIGYFGSWLPIKGSALLPELLIAVLTARPEWRARLVGPAPDVVRPLFPAALHARIECLPFTRDKAQLRQLYQQTSVALMPSIYESFGLVAAEALACGCALVATPVGFSAGLRDGEEAQLVTEPTTDAWLRALLNLLDNPGRRARMAAAGRARVQSLRWEPTVDQLEHHYRRLLRSRS
jgi:glycosyltransferase involved in cell wall biosynthesis